MLAGTSARADPYLPGDEKPPRSLNHDLTKAAPPGAAFTFAPLSFLQNVAHAVLCTASSAFNYRPGCARDARGAGFGIGFAADASRLLATIDPNKTHQSIFRNC